MSAGVVAVGGGLAAQRFCETLRRRGYDGPIRIVSDEPVAPYDRPPLSKQFLAGNLAAQDLSFRPQSWYREQGIELVLGRPAIGLDARRRIVTLADREELEYDDVLIATGSSPRRLAFAEGFENVFYLRTLADARRLRATIFSGMRLAVVGAGFIGQEVASTARQLGAEVTIVEALAWPLERIVGERLGSWFAELHRSEGVSLMLGRTVARLRGAEAVGQLVLDDGTCLRCDAVVIGVGVAPATDWLEGSGFGSDGVAVDEAGRSAVPHVYAAGDAALGFDPALGAHARCEHWEGAARQGAAAAVALLGLPVPVPAPASFWSDQYGVRIHYLGDASQADRVEIDGDPRSRDFTALFLRGPAAVAALLVGRSRELPAIRGRLRPLPIREGEGHADDHALLATG